ncbi:MAG TPA: dihydroorotase [Candidatus Thermoplasmatota archaeon]|nr:dihydroorotase [Candidatus Thermoplasmatota archaeon]
MRAAVCSPVYDQVFKGVLVRGGQLARGAVGVNGGRIVAVADDLPGDRVHDFGNALLLPGAIDPHVHFRDPGHPEKEDFETGTRSAAFGGVTCVLDMPNTKPATITREAFNAKRASVSAKAYVDFGLFAGLTSDPASLELLDEATALKIYMGSSTGDLLVENLALVQQALDRGAATGKTVCVHAEDEACMRARKGLVAHRTDFLAHEESRPNTCEAEAIRKVLALRRAPGARLHICHLSTREGLELLQGSGATCEVAPHHLYFTKRDLLKGGNFKMNPPLRSDEDTRALWAGLADGRVDCLASDHAPHTPGEKLLGVWECPSGVPGVETMVPLLIHAAKEGQVPWGRLVEAMGGRAGDIFGLPKGRIAPGYDADFAVYDLSRVTRVEAANLHSRCGWTSFTGLPAVFPTHVYLRGDPVIAEGRLVGARGAGRYLPGGARRAPDATA